MAENTLSDCIDHEDKLTRLLDLAAAIFAEKGYHHASIRDLSRETGVSLSGLYYYFSSKDELLYMIQERSLQGILARLDRKLGSAEAPEARLRALIENHVESAARHPAALRVLEHERAALKGARARKIEELRNRYTNRCVEILRELRRASGSADTVPINIAASGLFAMLNGARPAHDDSGRPQIERLADSLHKLFVGGFVGRAIPSLEKVAG